MTKDKIFFGCVQTLMVVVRLHPFTVRSKPAQSTTHVVARAGEFPEEALPDDVGQAAEDFINYAMGDGPEPGWHKDWREAFPEDVRPKW